MTTILHSLPVKELDSLSAKALVVYHDELVSTATATGFKKINAIWKGSKASLIERIQKLETVRKAAPEAIMADIHPSHVKSNEATKTIRHGGQCNSFIVEYCREHGLNAKIIRARMRKAGYSAPYTKESHLAVVHDLVSPMAHQRKTN